MYEVAWKRLKVKEESESIKKKAGSYSNNVKLL